MWDFIVARLGASTIQEKAGKWGNNFYHDRMKERGKIRQSQWMMDGPEIKWRLCKPI
jgi:hypothetical protein